MSLVNDFDLYLENLKESSFQSVAQDEQHPQSSGFAEQVGVPTPNEYQYEYQNVDVAHVNPGLSADNEAVSLANDIQAPYEIPTPNNVHNILAPQNVPATYNIPAPYSVPSSYDISTPKNDPAPHNIPATQNVPATYDISAPYNSSAPCGIMAPLSIPAPYNTPPTYKMPPPYMPPTYDMSSSCNMQPRQEVFSQQGGNNPVNPVRCCNGGQPLLMARKSSSKPKRHRTALTTDQVNALELEFTRSHYVDRLRRLELANTLNITDKCVKVWFQNRRMKEKKERMECPDSDISSNFN